ncbi:MAG: phosphoribosylanthranilate isomerase [Dehalococcoidaceae bacterium]|nr:phosphoribosylanthranilate isomerase [Dehalococcoidaceae bacterium]
MVKIKICGIRDAATARYCAGLGIDYIGLVLTESPRRISLEAACEIGVSLDGIEGRPRLAGVFVNQDYRTVNDVLHYCNLDVVQLSGDENMDYISRIEAPCIKSVHVLPSSTETELLYRVESLCGTDRTGARVLLDNRPDHRYGGSGKSFNWALAGKICARFPVMVAGGLTGQNVGTMVDKLQPWGVDVSSGVEKDGVKDPRLIKDFVAAAKGSDVTAGGNNE